MKVLNIKEILQNNLRQIEIELEHYARTGNQIAFLESLEDKMKIKKQLNK